VEEGVIFFQTHSIHTMAPHDIAALGLARCLAAQGKLDEAVNALSRSTGSHAGLHAALARLAFDRGNYDEAKKRADEALRLDRDQLLARWILAELDRVAGRLVEAERGYRRLVTFYNDHDVRQAEALRWIGLAAARNARWNRLTAQFDFLVNELYPEALNLEPEFWPAHYEAGLLFLEKHNRADALQELRAALRLNPNAAEVHAAMARLALEERDVADAEKSLARALEINPRLLAAWQLKADLSWANFQARETLALLEEKALPLNPRDEETLGRVAACYLLLDGPTKPGEPTRLARLIEKVTKENPHAGDFYFTLAVQLEARNKQPEAEQFFRKAIRVMPRMIGPQAELGQLYMRW
jgi:tetratricopeptide (TPR) repeat protein